MTATPKDAPRTETDKEDGEDDETLRQLMSETFGPKSFGEDEAESDVVQRGMEKLSQLEANKGSAHWLYEGSLINPTPSAERVCFRCSKAAPPASCSQCSVAAYCGRDCQTADWGKRGAFGGHKGLCPDYRVLGKAQMVPAEGRRLALERLLSKMRLYACPFAVHHAGVQGRGVLLLQSENTLAQLALPAPRDCFGHMVQRSVLLQYLTLTKVDEMLESSNGAFDDLTAPRAIISTVVSSHGDGEMVVLVRLRCGFVAALVTQLVPDLRICMQLATDYKGKEVLQLDLDDM